MKNISRWLQKNSVAIALSLLVFLLNQVFEFLHLYLFENTYEQLCTWDCLWYSSVIEHGYDLQPRGQELRNAANWAFFPAFTVVAKLFAILGASSAGTALLITSKFFFLLAIFSFTRFVGVYSPQVPTWVAVCVVGLNPYSLYGNVGYTESMFLCFSCATLVAVRQRKFLSAGLAGAVLSAVRPTGVFVILALLWSSIEQYPKETPYGRARMLFAVMLVPLGLAIFMVFLHRTVGDALAFSHVQIAWNRMPANPFVHLLNGLIADSAFNQFCAWMSLIAVSIITYLAIRGEYGLALFALCATLLPLSTGLSAMPRYLWWQAPLLLVVAQIFSLNVESLFHLKSNSKNSADASTVHWWAKIPLAIVAIPLCLWGLSVMYQGWILGKEFVI